MTKRDMLHQAIGKLAAMKMIQSDIQKLHRQAQDLEASVWFNSHALMIRIRDANEEIQNLKKGKK